MAGVLTDTCCKDLKGRLVDPCCCECPAQRHPTMFSWFSSSFLRHFKFLGSLCILSSLYQLVLGRGRDRQGLAARITRLLHKHEGQVVVAVHLRFQSLEAGRQKQRIPGASWAHLGTLPQWQGEGWQSVQMSVSDPHMQARTHRLACADSMHTPYTCKIRKSKQAEPSLPWHMKQTVAPALSALNFWAASQSLAAYPSKCTCTQPSLLCLCTPHSSGFWAFKCLFLGSSQIENTDTSL